MKNKIMKDKNIEKKAKTKNDFQWRRIIKKSKKRNYFYKRKDKSQKKELRKAKKEYIKVKKYYIKERKKYESLDSKYKTKANKNIEL